MAKKKKRQSAEFVKDTGAFADRGLPSAKVGNRMTANAKQKQENPYQPRDENATFGHSVQKSKQTETYRQNVQKPEQLKTVEQNARKSGTQIKEKTDAAFSKEEHFSSDVGKSAQKHTMQSRRKKQKKYQPQETFGQSDQKSEGTDATDKKDNDFSKEDSFFTEDCGEEQEVRQSNGDYRRRDTYHQSQKKGKYRRREYQDRQRIKEKDFHKDFQTKETTFAEGEDTGFRGSKKLDKLQKKAENAGKKVERAKKKLPKKTEYSLERVFDEKTGKAKYVLTAVKKEKPFHPDNPVKMIAGRAGGEYSNFAHSKVAEVEKENAAVEGAHKTEQKMFTVL